MNYAYIRVSSDKQTTENQRFEILKFADEKKIQIDDWTEEIVSGTRKFQERKLAVVLERMNSKDVLILTEVSRLGRSLMEIMNILNMLMEKEITVFTTKEKYELGNNISSKVLAFAFGLSAEIERNMISQRTKEALARKKKEGKKLGRPKGSLSKKTKLTGKEKIIRGFLRKGVTISNIAKILEVNRITLSNYIKSRKLQENL